MMSMTVKRTMKRMMMMMMKMKKIDDHEDDPSLEAGAFGKTGDIGRYNGYRNGIS